ncbi:tyrosine-type recombinase/integrase [Sphaerisporangium aureirubrum]|uniref:tyrosine-type recombinase/integrase n=1 Tax=Sphaerisporangium aureirubrum TaxID=1544736 RepID=UPI00362D6588
MPAADVQAVLDGCDRSSHVGIRDYAIMMLVARLGLRSIEVARLELRDVDWRAGELVIRGKAGRQDRLPLPVEVGEALVAYLSAGRNPEGGRQLFLTCCAPRRPIRADLVGDVVERACHRAGLPTVGPHRLRHALAGELLRQGAPCGPPARRHRRSALRPQGPRPDLRQRAPGPGGATAAAPRLPSRSPCALQAAAHQRSCTGVNLPAARACSSAVAPGNAPGLRINTSR